MTTLELIEEKIHKRKEMARISYIDFSDGNTNNQMLHVAKQALAMLPNPNPTVSSWNITLVNAERAVITVEALAGGFDYDFVVAAATSVIFRHAYVWEIVGITSKEVNGVEVSLQLVADAPPEVIQLMYSLGFITKILCEETASYNFACQ